MESSKLVGGFCFSACNPFDFIYVQTVTVNDPWQEQEGATLVVTAKFDKVCSRNIYLQFEEVS